ncbi:MAG: hypothetical protein A2Z25_01560 [Planctomycetes bacterium RBG_16_55_9]|nr:MAG: hypothetical protein A2Z25_01560 [Planctomycetes bacterium RBG_16_55_9]
MQKADIICTATVLSTQCQWKDDGRGRHIYTHVELIINRMIKGNLPTSLIDLEVVGGTVGDITEYVSDSPVFRASEQSLLFFESDSPRPAGSILCKIPILDDHVFWGGRKVSLEALCTSLALGIEDVPDESGPSVFADDTGTAPNINSIVPDIASAGTGTEVTIHGTGFGQSRGSGKVEFFYRGGEPRIESRAVSLWSDTQIVCTVPTGIINDYPASAGSGPVTVATLSGISNSYPFRVTFGYGGRYWWGENPVVSYYINENTSDCVGEGAAVQAAAETWNLASAGFQLHYAGSHTSAQSSGNDKNEILWGSTPSNALAITYTWLKQGFSDPRRSPPGYQIIECDMVFNDRRNWSTNPSAFEADVQSIALHELGHFFNLRDLYGDIGDSEYDETKVMYGYSDGSTLKRSLHPDDVAGVHWIYYPTSPPAMPDSIDYPSEDDGVYTIFWDACIAASSYQLERSMDGADWVQIYSGPHIWFDETVENGHYRYRVAASNAAGASGWRTGDWRCLVQFMIWEGRGEPNDPYLIRTADQLDRIGMDSRWWNKHFKLAADIDLSKFDGLSGQGTFHVIAPDESMPWTGVFDGNDHTISNFTCISSTSGHVGLLGCMAGPNAEIKRLRLVGADVEHLDASVGDRAGALVGLLREGTITGCYVDDADVSGRNRVGGLVGENVNGKIANCYADASVYGMDDVGGLVGYNSGRINASFTTGLISGSGWGFGGLAGANNPKGRISQCYSSSTTRGGERVGGLVGENRQGTIVQSYSTGSVRGTKGYVGGLVGDNLNGNVEASFWDMETSQRTTSDGGTGKTTAQMHTAGTYLEAGWDFVDETANGTEDTWRIDEGKDYPRLWWERN